ncbi:odorant receptor 22c-like [Pogonomyrmex barbatus]|uniref:Odorant receptor n=1 Tax=Pogonomyrmex barbatus TaxID=144034 RepID=A0A8N1S5A2_9HYME|nr:odorant receptor 22c-like [Pogonomyrmex barbatus]
MELVLDQYYKLNRQVLSIYGLWPYQNTTNAWIMRTFAILFMSWATFGQIFRICHSKLTTDFILDCLPIIIPNIGAIVQVVNRIIINDKLKSLFNQMKIHWACARSQNEIEILQTTAETTRLTTKLVLLYLFLGATTYMFSTLIPQILDVFLPLNESRSREHPFHAEWFLNEEKYFYVIRSLMYIALLFILGVVLVNGSVFVAYMQHANGMFTILGHRAEQSFNGDKHLLKNRSIREEDYGRIVVFIEDHRNILEFVDIIQSCYGLSLFLEFLSLMILIGATLVQIIKFTGLSDRSFRSVLYIAGQLMYMFMYSYMGQQLIDTSTQLFMKIYYIKWYNISVWKQKLMLFVMLKCMRTLSINAYNIYIFSLESFSTVSDDDTDNKLKS